MYNSLESACIKQNMLSKGLPMIEGDLPYLQFMMDSIHYYSTPVKQNRDWHQQVPLLVFDPEVITYD